MIKLVDGKKYYIFRVNDTTQTHELEQVFFNKKNSCFIRKGIDKNNIGLSSWHLENYSFGKFANGHDIVIGRTKKEAILGMYGDRHSFNRVLKNKEEEIEFYKKETFEAIKKYSDFLKLKKILDNCNGDE